jgi:hypothetical protein
MPDVDTTVTGETFTVRLSGWHPFNDGVRALLFGHMVKLAVPVVQHYHSDLYHDARWLEENVSGPTEFDWLVRPSGTNIAGTAKIGVEIGAGETARFYRVRVFSDPGRYEPRDDEGNWHVTFTRVSYRRPMS